MRKIAITLLCLTVIASFVPALGAPANAASAAKDSSYRTPIGKCYDCIKTEEYAYCVAGNAIYRVDVKTQKKKKLASAGKKIHLMQMVDGYLFYRVDGGKKKNCPIYRVDLKGKKNKKMTKGTGFVLGEKHLRYTQRNKSGKKKYYIMWFDGSHNKKATKTKIPFYPKSKKSNSVSYYVKNVKTGSKTSCYLVTPKGDVYLKKSSVEGSTSDQTDTHVLSTEDDYEYDMIKKGDYVYCYVGDRIYKVNLKKKKVKLLYCQKTEEHLLAMFMKNGYLYYYLTTGENSLHRITIKGEKHKCLIRSDDWRTQGYKLKNNKIYYYYIWGEGSYLYDYRAMDLDGSNKEALASYGSKPVKKICNVSGYWMDCKTIDVNDNDYKVQYKLVLPNNKKIKICTIKVNY